MNVPIVLGGVIVALILMSIRRAHAAPAASPAPAATAPPKATTIPSPWKDVSAAAWTRFVQILAGGRAFSTVTKNNFFGAFGFGVRRLIDLKIMKNLFKNEDGNWDGEWIVPKATFLASPSLQYDALAKSLTSYRNAVLEPTTYGKAIGTVIEGKKATLSGLLAVGHMAGGKGLMNWIDDPEKRKKLTFQTKAYHQANGLF